MDCTVPGILQARILEWVAFLFSRGSSQPRDRTQDSCIAGGFFTRWAIREAQRIDTCMHNTPWGSAPAAVDCAEAWLWGATTRPRSGAAAERNYPTPEVRGPAEWSSPTAKELVLCGRRRAERSCSTFKVRRGGREKIPLVQGKEQGLRASR